MKPICKWSLTDLSELDARFHLNEKFSLNIRTHVNAACFSADPLVGGANFDLQTRANIRILAHEFHVHLNIFLYI